MKIFLGGSSAAFNSCTHQRALLLNLALERSSTNWVRSQDHVYRWFQTSYAEGTQLLEFDKYGCLLCPKIDRKENSLQNVGKTRVYLFWRLYPRNTPPFFRFSMCSAFEFVDPDALQLENVQARHPPGKTTQSTARKSSQNHVQRLCQGNCCPQILKPLELCTRPLTVEIGSIKLSIRAEHIWQSSVFFCLRHKVLIETPA